MRRSIITVILVGAVAYTLWYRTIGSTKSFKYSCKIIKGEYLNMLACAATTLVGLWFLMHEDMYPFAFGGLALVGAILFLMSLHKVLCQPLD